MEKHEKNNKKDKDAAKLISEGDEYMAKKKYTKALKRYKKAKELAPERTDLYDKLIKAHDLAVKEEDWHEDDVADSVGWTMEKQELENPALKLLHERLTPEWNNISAKISALITSESEDDEIRIVEEIRAYGHDAIYPLIFTLLQIKKGATQKSGD